MSLGDWNQYQRESSQLQDLTSPSMHSVAVCANWRLVQAGRDGESSLVVAVKVSAKPSDSTHCLRLSKGSVQAKWKMY